MHILYRDDGSGFLRYATGNTGQWAFQQTTLSSPSDDLKAGIGSLQIDSNNTLHYVYLDHLPAGSDGASGILYSALINGVWQTETAFTSSIGTTGGGLSTQLNQISLALDVQESPHVVFKDGDNLRHLFQLNGIWQSEIAVTANQSNTVNLIYNSIQFDSSDVLHICYNDSGDVYCANNSTGSWLTELVDDRASIEEISSLGTDFSNGYVGTGIDLEIDSNSNLHVSYFGLASPIITSTNPEYYLRYSTNAGGSWVVQTQPLDLESRAIVNSNKINSFFFANGNLGVVYLDQYNNSGSKFRDLSFLLWNGASWSEKIVDNTSIEDFPVGIYSSLAIDAQGNPGTSYNTGENELVFREGGTSEIEYASLNGNGEWLIEKPLDADNPLISSSRLQNIWNGFDSLNQPHIIVHDFGSVLGFAHVWKSGGSWLSEVIPVSTLNITRDDNGVVQEGFSVYMDENDAIHTAHLTCNPVTRETLLVYSTNESGSWESEVAYDYGYQDLPASNVFKFCPQPWVTDVVAAEDGDIYITFLYRHPDGLLGIDQNLRQVRKSGSVWSLLLNEDVLASSSERDFVTLESINGSNMGLDLLTENDGTIHFVYNVRRQITLAGEALGLRYSKHSNGVWRHRHLNWNLIPPSGDNIGVPESPSITLKDDGHIYVSYFHEAYDELRIINTSNSLNTAIVLDSALDTVIPQDRFDTHNYTATNGDSVRTTYYHEASRAFKTAVNVDGFDISITSPNMGFVDNGDGTLVKQLIITNSGAEPIYFNEAILFKEINIATLFAVPRSVIFPFSRSSDSCTGQIILAASSCSIAITINQSDVNTGYVDVMTLSLSDASRMREQVINVEFSTDLTFSQLPAITAPLTGVTLASTTETVTWDAMGTQADYWAVLVGTNGPGSFNLHNTGALPANTSSTSVPFPGDGSDVTVSLFAFQNGSWSTVDSELVTTFSAPAPAAPEITSPLTGVTLTSTTETVSWDAMGTQAEFWAVLVGTNGPGSFNLHNTGALPANTTSASVPFPGNGSDVTVSLFAFINGGWSTVDSELVTTFSAPAPAAPEITSPLTGVTLTSTTETVSWDAMGTQAEFWAVLVGTNGPGSLNLHNTGALPANTTSASVPFPGNGSDVTVSLFAFINGGWSTVDSELVTTFSAPAPAAPEITSPLTGVTLTSTTETVSWDAMGTQAEFWAVLVGRNGPGSFDLHNTGALPANTTSASVPFPGDGSDVTVSLFAFINGGWSTVDSELVTTFSAPAPAAPEITSPLTGVTLTSTTETVSWDAMGTQAEFWAVLVGTNGPGSFNLHNTGALPANTTSASVPFPGDGSDVTVSLFAFINGSWSTVDSELVTTFSAPAPAAPEITSPLTGVTLASTTETVTWDAMGTQAEFWAVLVGRNGPGSFDLHNTGALPANTTSASVPFPGNGSDVTVSLFAFINGGWSTVDSELVTTFSAPAPAAPEITSPLTGVTLTSTTETVSWDAMGTQAEFWAVLVGTNGPGSLNLHNTGALPANTTSASVPFPADDSEVTVSLYAFQNGRWSTVDSEVVTVPNYIAGVFPVSGSFLETNCQDPADNGASTITGTFVASAQTGGAFSGNLSIATLNGFPLAGSGVAAAASFNGTHTISASSGNYTLDGTSSGSLIARNQGSFNATLSGDAITVNMSGNDTIGDTCSLTGSFTGNRL